MTLQVFKTEMERMRNEWYKTSITYTTIGQLTSCRIGRSGRELTLPVAGFDHVFVDEKQNKNSSALLSLPVHVKPGGRITQCSDGMQTAPHVKPICRYSSSREINAKHFISITNSLGSAPYREVQNGLKAFAPWLYSVTTLILDRNR